MKRIFSIAVALILISTGAQAGIISGDERIGVRSGGLFQQLQPFFGKQRVPIACTAVYRPDGSRNCIYDDGTNGFTGPVRTNPVPIACTGLYRPDGSRNCIYADGTGGTFGPAGPIWSNITGEGQDLSSFACTTGYFQDGRRNCNFPTGGNAGGVITIANPVTCTLRETPDGIVSDCSRPTTTPNQVPAPGGLLLMLAGLGLIARKKHASA